MGDSSKDTYCIRNTYSLIQQTPLIHFQAGQQGAVLRASEVKPKLDRFITQLLGPALPDRWRIGTQDKKEALNYKLQLIARGKPIVNQEVHKLYFGNTGKLSAKKAKTVFYQNNEKNGIELRITSFVNYQIAIPASLQAAEAFSKHKSVSKITLLEFIDSVLPAFFSLHCFGTRSTKGFGSFVIKGRIISCQELAQYCPEKCLYYVDYPDGSIPANMLDDIWVIYSMLKAGINFHGYYKGRIFRYFTEGHEGCKSMGSDKAFIKQRVLTIGSDFNIEQSEKFQKYNDFRFSRAMLGLAQKYEYRSGKNTKRYGTVNVQHARIARFASPIQCKPEPGAKRLLIIPQIIPDIMYNTSFEFNSKRNKIKTPSKAEFNLINYLDWFRQQFNEQKDMTEKQNAALKIYSQYGGKQNCNKVPQDVAGLVSRNLKIKKIRVCRKELSK